MGSDQQVHQTNGVAVALKILPDDALSLGCRLIKREKLERSQELDQGDLVLRDMLALGNTVFKLSDGDGADSDVADVMVAGQATRFLYIIMKYPIVGTYLSVARSIDACSELLQIVAVADLMEEKRRDFMDQYNIPKGYRSHTELLEDGEIDAVGVVLGHQLHHRLVVDSCNAGKHVLVEKPMALSLEQCDEMIAAAAAKNVKLMVGHTQHF